MSPLHLDHAIPLLERPALMGFLKLFQETAKKHGLTYVDLLSGRAHGAAAIRRRFILELHEAGQRTGVIAWLFGTHPSHIGFVLKKAREERKDFGGASEYSGRSAEAKCADAVDSDSSTATAFSLPDDKDPLEIV